MAFLAPAIAPILGTGAASALGGTAASSAGLGSLLGAGGATGGALNSLGLLGLEKLGQPEQKKQDNSQTQQPGELELLSKILNPAGPLDILKTTGNTGDVVSNMLNPMSGLPGMGPGPQDILKLFA